MKFMFEETEEMLQVKEELGLAQSALLKKAFPEEAQKIIPANINLVGFAKSEGFFVLREGVLSVLSDQRELFMYQPGDIVFDSLSLASKVSIRGEFPVKCDFYPIESFLRVADGARSFCRLVRLHQEMMVVLVKHLHRGEKRAEPSIHTIRAGEHIVTEGVTSDRVYALLEGHADVFSGGERVGEVKADEAVGVIGALCGIPRIATVTASVDCMVMSLSKDDFVDLLSLRPQMVIKLIEDFARVISASNNELREYRAKSKSAVSQ